MIAFVECNGKTLASIFLHLLITQKRFIWSAGGHRWPASPFLVTRGKFSTVEQSWLLIIQTRPFI